MKKVIIFYFLFFILCPSLFDVLNTHAYALRQTPAKAGGINTNEINSLSQKFMSDYDVSSLSIGVIKNNKITTFNYGYSDKDKKIKTSDDSIYTIASFTKTFTGTLAAVAQAEGKLNLDDPFVKYYPQVAQNPSLHLISMRMLLGHVASFPFEFYPDLKDKGDLDDRLNTYTTTSIPGSQYRYSNISISIAGYALEHAYNQDYESLLKQKLLDPLNMTSTYLNLPQSQELKLVQGYNNKNEPVLYQKKYGVLYSSGALKSTIKDMAKYVRAHMDPDLIKNKNVSQALKWAHENSYCFDDSVSCEQLAWQSHLMSQLDQASSDSLFLDYDADGRPNFTSKKIIENKSFNLEPVFIDKTGSGYGRAGYMAYIPHKKIGVVILLNKAIGIAGNEKVELGRRILKSLY